MTDNHIKLAAQITQHLDHAQIPSVVWGPLVWPDIIVPDHLIHPAYETLLAAGFPACPQKETCIKAHYIQNSPTPGEWHVHGTTEHGNGAIICLYKKSERLWTLPDFELGLPAPNDPNFIFASDDRLSRRAIGDPSGPSPSSLHPVKVPTPRYVEAILLLCCRDYGYDHYDYWRMQLNSVNAYVKCTEMKVENLQPRFQSLWKEALPPWEDYKELLELHKNLVESNELPPSPARKRRFFLQSPR